MTIEEKLREYILTYYKSIREFTQKAEIPYSTMDGILKRGIANSSIGNVLKVCQALGISADELARNKVVPNRGNQKHILISEIPEMLKYMRKNREEYNDLTIDGKPLSENEFDTLLDMNEMTVNLIMNKRERVR